MAKNSPFLINIGQGLSMIMGLPNIPSWNTADRPKKARSGTIGFNSQTNNLEYWDGAAWFVAPMNET